MQSISKRLIDITVDVYLRLLCSKNTKFTVVSCFFIESAEKDNEKAIKVIKKRIGKLHEFVLLPINVQDQNKNGYHWFLVIGDLKNMVLNVFDSMPLDSNYAKLDLIMRIFVKACDERSFTIKHHNVCRQRDGFSCGLFCMLYAKLFLMELPITLIKNDASELYKRRIMILLELLLNDVLEYD